MGRLADIILVSVTGGRHELIEWRCDDHEPVVDDNPQDVP
jgi:hypothetical protein